MGILIRAMTTYAVDFAAIEDAARRIAGLVHRTPVMTCATLNRRAGRNLFFKSENLQKGGAFKFRGACNAVGKLSPEAAARGVVTHSSGNHAQALALAAGIIAAVAYQGLVVQAVRDIQDGVRDLSLGGLFRSVSKVLAPLLWTAILVGLGVFVGFLAVIVPGLVLLTWWAVAAPVVVCEVRTPTEAIRRSRALVRGHGWQVFSVLVVTFLKASPAFLPLDGEAPCPWTASARAPSHRHADATIARFSRIEPVMSSFQMRSASAHPNVR